MFSSRLQWDMQLNPIAKLLARKRAAGTEILDLSESNPTNAQLSYPVHDIVSAFSDPQILRYDPNPAGMRSAREAVCEYYGGAISPDRVLLTTSTSEAYAFLFKLLTDPGDEVLVPRPSYPLFEFLAGMELVRVAPYPLVYHGTWEIDFDALARQANDRTRAIVLVNPNNPTGSFLHSSELEPLVRFCRDHCLALISDEVFADYGFGADTNRVTSLRGVSDVLTFCLSGLSKVAALPQVKLGWILVSGPEPVRTEAKAKLELIADTYLSVGAPVQIAAQTLFRSGTTVRDQIVKRTTRNLAALRESLAADSPALLRNVEGGWYATLQVPKIRTEEEWVLDLIERSNVLVQPGYFYDFQSEAFLILSLLTHPEVFDAGLARLQAHINCSS